MNQPLGSVIEGSLSEGLEVRLHPDISVEEMRVGKFLVVQGSRSKFFCLLTDVSLGTSTPRIFTHPPDPEDDFWREVLAGSDTYGTIEIAPMLMLSIDNSIEEDSPNTVTLKNAFGEFESKLKLLPVKTIPSHFSQVYESTEQDFRSVFGWEDDPYKKNFAIGKPLDMEVPICLDLDRFVERSNGIFGKSGTGKSFLTRLLISGIIRKQAAVNLMFDMHSEYGWEAVSEGKQLNMVKGLRQLFPKEVEIYTLDPKSTKRRGVPNSRDLFLSYDQIEIEDLRLISRELGLSEASLDNANILAGELGRDWIYKLINMTNEDIEIFCNEKQGHKGSIMALQRKLKRLESLKYMKSVCPHNYINEILALLDGGKHVVVEFGSQGSMLSYMLVTNMITRRIHRAYVKKAETFLQTKNTMDKPRPLVITIEEAHRFLDSKIVHQTIFGTIAREMRKYFVTLLVVDQRPSGIDNEVMSQVGTRITCLLNDEKDIDAIFTGVSGASGLRSVLAKLDSKQQALVLGHAVPMPVVVRTRAYDQQFYAEVGEPDWQTMDDDTLRIEAKKAKSDLGF
ncbi:helicase HerA domain-containing protein [Cyanobacterium sp. IPPAS B-1200]|uniref:helicase HerA domain-containing protein n=1 Tax=Cyanobacterium sp. IPPAS B-1200 TaxID=1562720 RepID=UPI0008526F16|nr:ATP-binding protein [Cyanobacterium sp. IPPAS B-1200]OEJ78651.1 ATPase [Cyanobacterium sp. IPPAS B-1200]